LPGSRGNDVFLEKKRILPYKNFPTLLNFYQSLSSRKMGTDAYIIFSVDDQYYALPVGAVKQIIRAVQTTAVPEAPELLSGLINMGGDIIPVVNIRKQFKRPQREISVSDRIIIAQAPPHTIAFIVDDITDIAEFPETEITPSAGIFPKMEDYVSATAKFNGHTVLIYDIGCLFPEQTIEEITHHLSCTKESS
jgi:purine-binding chemotaxis protein CheW